MPETLDRLSFRLLPGCCLLCGCRSGRRIDICLRCERDLPWHDDACPRCAQPMPAGGYPCGSCLKTPPPQDGSLAAFRYEWPLDSLIQRFKFNGDHATGRMLGKLFTRRVARETPPPDCLLPVPLHASRLRERGFNQSMLLAESMAAALGIGIRNDIIERSRETTTQSGMDALARRRNVRGAFSLAGEPPGHVAIVDDVMTTGSTTAEMTKLLRKAGVRTVEVWTLARAV